MAEFTGILYRKAGGTTELNRSVGGFCAIESATLEDRWQDGGTIDLSVVTSGTMVFYDGDYVVVKGRPYEIRETISEYTAIDDTRNRYAIKLHYPDIRFKRAIMYNTVEQEDGGVFSWMRPNNTIVTEGSFQTLVETCCYNANEVANERVFKIGTINEDIETDFRVLSFSDTNCWATLKQICEEWNTFYTIRANTDVTPDSLYIIDFGAEPDPFPETISIGKNKGISELKLNYSDSDVYTQFIVLGSTENLPSAYPNERLQLDTDLEATPPVYDYSMIVADDKYAQWGRKRMELVYEYIKPTRTGTITGLPENNIFAFYDTDLATVLAEEPTWNPVGGTVHVVEGPLLGYTFEIIGWHAATYKITIKQISDSNGLLLPNEDEPTFRFTDGTGGTAVTKYNLADIPLPTSYVTDARTRLKERAVTVGIPYWSQPRASFSLSVDPFFTRNKEVELSCGMLIPIVHQAMSINKSIRIKRISYNLLKDKYFDVESVEVSDIEQDNYMNSVHKDVQRTISTIKTAGYVTPSVTKQNNLTTLYNSIVSGYGFISYEDFIKWCADNKGIMIQALEGEVGSEELVHIINADLLRVNDAFANRILANEAFINKLIVKCLLTDVDDQGFRFDIRTINIDEEQVSQFKLYDPDDSVKAKILMQGIGNEVSMNIENAQIGTSTDKDGFRVNDIDENGNKTERVKLANGEMSLSDTNTNKGLLVKADRITFQQRVGDETTEIAAISVDTIPHMIYTATWAAMTEAEKRAIPLAYIYDINNVITNIYRYGGYPLPGINITLYASAATSTDNKWSDMNNAAGSNVVDYAYCNRYNDEPRLYLSFDVSSIPDGAGITQFTIECKVRGAEGFAVTNKLWGGILLNSAEQWDWDISNNDSIQTRYMYRSGSFTKAQLIAMRALFRSDLNGNSALNRAVRVYYAKLSLTYLAP